MPHTHTVSSDFRTTRHGFTLVELLVVIAIIGLLSTVAVVSLETARAKARDAKRKTDLLQISKAIDLYNDTNGSLPRTSYWCTTISNTTLNWGPDFQADIAPFIGKVPLDPQKANQAGDYFYFNLDDVSKYAICAILEKPADSYTFDPSPCAMSSVYNYCIMPNGGF